jgi:hypothetical protein
MPHKDPIKRAEYLKAYNTKERRNNASKRYFKTEKGKLAIRSGKFYRKYGITLEHRAAMISAQDGCCAICNSKMGPANDCCVDHNHVTNQMRGLLCKRCNFAIGLMKDNPFIAEKAFHYLLKWQSNGRE